MFDDIQEEFDLHGPGGAVALAGHGIPGTARLCMTSLLAALCLGACQRAAAQPACTPPPLCTQRTGQRRRRRRRRARAVRRSTT
jgi:hypothetical protein